MRGRITVFVLPRRYDYNEFATMVEKRSIPTEWQSHWMYDGVDAYVAIVAGSDDKDETLKARMVGTTCQLSSGHQRSRRSTLVRRRCRAIRGIKNVS